MAYTDKIFTRTLTDDEEKAMFYCAPDYQTGTDEKGEPVMESAIDREFLQAINNVINPCMQKYMVDAAKDTTAKALEIHEKYMKLAEKDQKAVDAILATAAVDVNPVEPDIKG